jgi:hypothetical protein
MSGAEAVVEPTPSEHLSLEARLFRASPFGLVGTCALIFALAVAGFLLVAALVRYPLITKTGVALDRTVPGLVGPLLLATALGMNRYADLKQRDEIGVFGHLQQLARLDRERLEDQFQRGHRVGLLGLRAPAVLAGVHLHHQVRLLRPCRQ